MEKRKSNAGRPKTSVKEKIESIKFDYDKVRQLVQDGRTDIELGKLLGVSKQTINRWKNESPEFALLLKEAKENADLNVEISLYKRAVGFKQKDTYFSSYKGNVIQTEYEKYFVPEVLAQIFWLKNRQPDRWRDKPIETIGEDDGINITVKFV